MDVARITRPPSQDAMPISLPVAAPHHGALQTVILSEPGATFTSDSAAVLWGLARGQKWCSAGRRPYADVWRRIWEPFRDIVEEAHIDSVTKCTAHLSTAEQAKLGRNRPRHGGRQRTGRRADQGGERLKTLSKLYCATCTKQPSRQAGPSSAISGAFNLQTKGPEPRPDVVTTSSGMERKRRAMEARGPDSGASAEAGTQGKAMVLQSVWQACKRWWRRRQSWLALNAWGHPANTLGEQARHQCRHLTWTGRFVWCCRCGAIAAKFEEKLGEPRVGATEVSRVCAECARSMRLLSRGWYPKENRFLGSSKLFTAQAWARWRQSYQGEQLGESWAGPSSSKAVDRLRAAEAQPADPVDKKREIKWCWTLWCAR